jgi:predicted ester cyclase
MENENTQVVRRWFEEVWNKRRLETIDELLAADAVAHDLGGTGASTTGPEEFRKAAQTLLSAFGKFLITVEDIFGAGDRVAVRLLLTLKSTGRLGTLEPTGKEATVPVMCIVKIRDGKIVEGWNFWDVSAALRAADAPPSQMTIF